MASVALSPQINLKKLLPAGSQAAIGAHVVPFPGDPRHRSVGYDQASPAVIAKQMALMQAVGISFVTIDWYGSKDRSQQVLLGWMDACEKSGGTFRFAVMADGHADVLNIPHVYESPAYLDRLLLTFPANWAAPIPPGMRWLRHGAGGGFLWMELPRTPPDTPLTVLRRQYESHPAMGVVFSQFNDSDPKAPAQSVWGGAARRWDDPIGETWRGCWEMIPPSVKYIQLCTWNDYEESTALEGWISKLTGAILP